MPGIKNVPAMVFVVGRQKSDYVVFGGFLFSDERF